MSEVEGILGTPDQQVDDIWTYYEKKRGVELGWRNGGALGLNAVTSITYKALVRPLVWLVPKEYFTPRMLLMMSNFLVAWPGYFAGAFLGVPYGMVVPLDDTRVKVAFNEARNVAAITTAKMHLSRGTERFAERYGLVEIPLLEPEKAGGYSFSKQEPVAISDIDFEEAIAKIFDVDTFAQDMKQLAGEVESFQTKTSTWPTKLQDLRDHAKLQGRTFELKGIADVRFNLRSDGSLGVELNYEPPVLREVLKTKTGLPIKGVFHFKDRGEESGKIEFKMEAIYGHFYGLKSSDEIW